MHPHMPPLHEHVRHPDVQRSSQSSATQACGSPGCLSCSWQVATGVGVLGALESEPASLVVLSLALGSVPLRGTHEQFHSPLSHRSTFVKPSWQAPHGLGPQSLEPISRPPVHAETTIRRDVARAAKKGMRAGFMATPAPSMQRAVVRAAAKP